MVPTPRRAAIARLPEVVRNQIAAGEVVERPASVVKELVENALDAGAAHVRIDLEGGGVELVRVVDDGSGMGPEDLQLAFEPHATSKLASVADLEHIASLGFRGEALASIGSVARARAFSRLADDDTGFEIADEGGRIGELREAGGARGTAIEVRDLFYNTPARRRFLKRPATELARALDVIQRLALAHPGVGFVVTHDGRRVFDVEAEMDLRARVRRTFGAELADSLVGVEAHDGDTRVAGFVAPPRFARRDAGRQMWFLNGRPLRDRVLTRCLREAYRGYLMDGRQPCAFLLLSLDPAAVDVNVHPTKAEVRFRDERRLFGFLVSALREAVRRVEAATPGESLLATAQRRAEREARARPLQPSLPDPGALPRAPRRPEEALSVREVPGPPLVEREPARAPARAGSAGWEPVDELRGPFLQVARTYLVRALEDGFEVIDQHALHERVTLDGLERDIAAGRLEVQRALIPELVELARDEVALVAEHVDALAKVGLELAPFGDTTVAVHGLPALLRHPDPQGIVRDAVALLREAGRAPDAEQLLEDVLHRMACRSSVMAGDALGESEIRSLLRRAAAIENDQTCAHGRPTRVRFTLADLERAFHRR